MTLTETVRAQTRQAVAELLAAARMRAGDIFIIGCSSSLLPIPYMTAATCLHMLAQSGQVQLNDISAGDGNSPFLDLNRSATSSGI